MFEKFRDWAISSEVPLKWKTFNDYSYMEIDPSGSKQGDSLNCKEYDIVYSQLKN
jgi:hypothetical protein